MIWSSLNCQRCELYWNHTKGFRLIRPSSRGLARPKVYDNRRILVFASSVHWVWREGFQAQWDRLCHQDKAAQPSREEMKKVDSSHRHKWKHPLKVGSTSIFFPKLSDEFWSRTFKQLRLLFVPILPSILDSGCQRVHKFYNFFHALRDRLFLRFRAQSLF